MDLYQYYLGKERLLGSEQIHLLPEYIIKQFRLHHIHGDETSLTDQQRMIVAQDPWAANEYARLTDKPFPEGEAAIATDPEAAYDYAIEVLGNRFPRGEAVIASRAYTAIEYAVSILQSRFPRAEAIIAQDPYNAFRYALRILKRPWPEAEPAILKDPDVAADYAANLKGPWPEAETLIAASPTAALEYATRALKAPWPEGEAAIMSNASTRTLYQNFLKNFKRAKTQKKPK